MLRDLSYRYKIPLAFTGVILLTAVALASTTAVRTYESARSDLLASAQGLGAVLAGALWTGALGLALCFGAFRTFP